jgi:hypothetical protein
MNDQREDSMNEHIRIRLDGIEQVLDEWKREPRILTNEQIDFLKVLADKNIRNLSNKQELTDNQRGMKTNVHHKLRDGFSDIDRMINLGFIGERDLLSPLFYGRSKTNRYPYDKDTWREDFPVQKVCNFIERLVKLYGDDYALPIANAIRIGLESRENVNNTLVDVPILRRSRSGLF